MLRFALIMLIILSSATAATDMGIFNILQESFADSPGDLPIFTPVPDKNIQKSTGNIIGWIDIVGFKEMLRDGGTDYVPGKPEDYAIVLYDTWASYEITKCETCAVVYIKNVISVSGKDNLTVAKNNIELKWSEIFVNCDSNGCWSYTTYTTERAEFRTQVYAPQEYDTKLSNFTVFITEYNNTISPKVSVVVPRQDGAFKTTIQYGKSTAVHYYGIGTVEWSRKKVPYLNLTGMDYWTVTGDMSRLGDYVLINGTTLNYSQLNVSISTPYNAVYSQNYSIEKIDYTPEKTWNPVFFMVIGTVGILGWSIKKFVRTI